MHLLTYEIGVDVGVGVGVDVGVGVGEGDGEEQSAFRLHDFVPRLFAPHWPFELQV
jgi:hypothetical protein